MNHLILFAAVVVLSLHFKSLSSQSQKPYSRSHDADEIFVQSFKTKLLKELGLSSVPNVSAAKVPSLPAISKHFVEAENRKFDQPVEEEDKFHAKTKRIFLFPDQVTALADIAGKNYTFKSNTRYSNLEIKSAIFWLHITEASKSTGKVGHQPHLLQLYKAFKAPSGKTVHTRQLFHSETLNNTGWYSVQLSAVVKEWVSKHRKEDLRLDVSVTGKSLEIDGVDDEAERQWRPFLVVDTEEKKQLNRKRRNEQAKDVCGTRAPVECCRHNFIVNFRDIGLEFIIFPKTLSVHRCAGSCESFAFQGYKSRFTTLAAFSKMTRRSDWRNCCVPKQLAPASLLLLNEDSTVELKLVHNIRVLSCDCVV